MWKYFSVCLQHGRRKVSNNKKLGDLAQTVMVRCDRALRARDEVGFQFYRRQDNATREGMAYHFDYLTILTSGALDAEARIARQVYGLEKVPANKTNFRSHEFRERLRRAGAGRLADILEDKQFRNFQRFLGALRNSVHSTGLRGFALERRGEQEASFLQVFEGNEDILKASSALGPRSDVGVEQQPGIKGFEVVIEPYTCALRLSELGLTYIDQIAEATDVERLLAGDSAQDLMTRPPESGIFGGDIRRRVDALG